MKKVLLSMLACSAIGAAANAQGLLVYGSIGYTTNNTRDIDNAGGSGTPTYTDRTLYNFLDFSPGIGYMINDNLAVGIQLNAIGSKLHTDSDVPGSFDTDVRGFAIGGGPFVRATKNMGEHFYTFTQATVSYLNGRTKFESSAPGVTYDPVDRYDGVRGSIIPAVGVKITPIMSIAVSFGGLQYDYTKTKFDVGQNPPAGLESTSKTSNFGVNFGQQAHLTAQWMFGSSRRSGNAQPGDDMRRMNTDDDDNGGTRRRRSRDMDDE